MRDNISWQSWVYQAAAYIRFAPDREAVQEELLAHLEDKTEGILRREEIPVYDAEKKALAEMGDAKTVGQALAAVHKPLLGYLWLWSRRIVILCLCVAVWACLGVSDLWIFQESDSHEHWKRYGLHEGAEEYYEYTELTPTCRDKSDGFTFSIPAAAVIQNEEYTVYPPEESDVASYQVETGRSVYFIMRAQRLLPWGDYLRGFRAFYAVDDLGNHYYSMAERGIDRVDEMQRQVRGNYSRTGIRTQEYGAWITSVDPEAQWLELRYDRDGRDVRLRFSLTGGEGA